MISCTTWERLPGLLPAHFGAETRRGRAVSTSAAARQPAWLGRNPTLMLVNSRWSARVPPMQTGTSVAGRPGRRDRRRIADRSRKYRNGLHAQGPKPKRRRYV